MLENILNLGDLKLNEVKNFRNKDFNKIYEDLVKVGFYSEEIDPLNPDAKKVFTILRLNPDYNDKINGRNYK